MHPVILMILALPAVAVDEVRVCQRCHHRYSVAPLSRSSMARITGEVVSRHGMRHGRSAMMAIAWRESRFKPTTRNKRSSAYGLWGFLNSTWAGTGIRKTACPYCQTEAALRYMRGRYGTPERAHAFHRRRNWY